MTEIIILILLVLTIVLFKLIFKINLKKAKELEQNKELEKITDRFPENIEIAKQMLEMLDNKKVKVEQTQNTKTSLYIAITDKISIADMKTTYARIQTIAHECIHSVQDRTLLLFNFIFSNITIIYFLVISVLTICKVLKDIPLQISILLILGIIQFAIRSFLEIDAMTKSKYLAKQYIEDKDLSTKQEIQALMKEYDKINTIGVPFIIDNLLTNMSLRIIVYIIISMIL